MRAPPGPNGYCLAAVTEDSAVTAAVVWHIRRG
jgi:hypothetical protein